MIAGFNTSISGLKASATRMAVSAHDVANVNTKGYEQSDVIQTTASQGTQIAAIRKTPNNSPEQSGTDLAQELGGEATIAKASYSANLKVIQTQDEMLGSLLDINS